ncbi:MAG TPA: MiaB/RimO family radical SAM methylthiotransferase, partial [Thermosynergistes sp.]|nr:MiaB/RimO family radical SAM methylthiotransferase [Thermosynergistes sp.]
MRPLEGKRIFVHALGCRTNIYEASALSSMLSEEGAQIVDRLPFDIAIVLTCTVTSTADKKCRQLIRRLRHESPDAAIVACGCFVQRTSREDLSALGVDLAVGSRLKGKLPELLSALLEGKIERGKVLTADLRLESGWDDLRLSCTESRARAFLKVQDGCDRFCSYCVIPFVRGRPVSRGLDDVESEARRLVEGGCRELILTGVNLGLYGSDISSSLGELVRRLGCIGGLSRLRFGSIEPFAVNEELLRALAETPKFCPHLHIPLQSGDDGVLARMERGYTSADFAKMTERVRAILGEDVHLSTDLLVGFPGEDEAAFGRSLKLLSSLGFGRLHVFPYSPRPGTKACGIAKKVGRKVAHERVREAIVLGKALLDRYASRWL